MSKEIILLDETVSIPLPLIDNFNKDAETKIAPTVELNPTAIVSNELADKMVKTYPFKYAIYDKGNKDHQALVKKGKYPEAKKVLAVQLSTNFEALSKDDKIKVLEFIKGLKSGANAVQPVEPNSIKPTA